MSHQSDWIYYKQPIKFLVVKVNGMRELVVCKCDEIFLLSVVVLRKCFRGDETDLI